MIGREAQKRAQKQRLEITILLPCWVCCLLSTVVRLLFSLLCLDVLARAGGQLQQPHSPLQVHSHLTGHVRADGDCVWNSSKSCKPSYSHPAAPAALGSEGGQHICAGAPPVPWAWWAHLLLQTPKDHRNHTIYPQATRSFWPEAGSAAEDFHLHLPVRDLPKPTHEVRVRAETEGIPAWSFILPLGRLVAPLSQMLWSDYVAKKRGEVEEVGLGRQIQQFQS